VNAIEDMHRRHLPTHAEAMGGGLSASYVYRGYEDAAIDLVDEGLAEWVSKGGHSWWGLTLAGEGCGGRVGWCAVSRFGEGDRVYHRTLEMFGTYQGRHNRGDPATSPESSSYVLFDGDSDWPDGRPVTTDLLVPAAEVGR
jgi:hypothetical protein